MGIHLVGADTLRGRHELDELLVVDLAVTVNVRLADHLIDLLVGELLTEVGHDVTKLSGGDETIAITIEDLEGLDQLLLSISVLHLTGHEGEELGELNGAIAIGIVLIDRMLNFGLSWVLSKLSHRSTELLGADGAISVLIEQVESLLEFSDLLFGQLISHCVILILLHF